MGPRLEELCEEIYSSDEYNEINVRDVENVLKKMF